jgi:hypothetical protein
MKTSQRAVVINESGLYALILSSKLAQAKAFKRNSKVAVPCDHFQEAVAITKFKSGRIIPLFFILWKIVSKNPSKVLVFRFFFLTLHQKSIE